MTFWPLHRRREVLKADGHAPEESHTRDTDLDDAARATQEIEERLRLLTLEGRLLRRDDEQPRN